MKKEFRRAMQELAILASRALTTQRQFTSVADNVANVNTHGYKRLDLQFKEVVSRPAGHATASHVADRALFIDYSAGPLQVTDSPLHVAVVSEGMLAVQVNDSVHYTRNGQMLLANDGTLVTPQGYPILDNANSPIQVPENSGELTIGRDGTMSTREGILAQLGVFTFSKEDYAKLQRSGESLYVPQLGAAAVPVETPRVQQGALETSNVNPTLELVNMEMVSKNYQNSLKLLKSMEDLEQQSIRTLGGLN